MPAKTNTLTKLTKENFIAYLSLNRTEKRNSINLELIKEIIQHAKNLKSDSSIKIIIITAEGADFSTGLDFVSSLSTPIKLFSMFLTRPITGKNLFQQSCLIWRTLPQPVICVIKGRCWGGGLQLALGADFRYATPDAQLSIMEAQWGLIPDMGASITLAEILPIDIAKRLTMTGEIFSSQYAKEIGLITDFYDDPMTAAQQFAELLSSQSSAQLAATKKLFHKSWHKRVRVSLKTERYLQLYLSTLTSTRALIKNRLKTLTSKSNHGATRP